VTRPHVLFSSATLIRGLAQLSAVFALAFLPGYGTALILDRGDGLGNTTAPEDDPGWANIGHHLGSPSVVYLGNRWILTAHHVGASIVIFDGKRYNPVSGSPTSLRNPDGTLADLLLFRIDEDLPLPSLSISKTPARVGEEVMLIAAGSSRGGRVTLESEAGNLLDGFLWVEDQTKRWGTNRVEARPQFIENLETKTMSFPILFDRIENPTGTRHEASAGRGDSGGALFAHTNSYDPNPDWVLSGILFSVSGRTGHPANTSFYGDITWVADLSFYRDEILRHTSPETVQMAELESNELEQSAEASGSAKRDPSRAAALALVLIVAALIWRIARRRSFGH
jgi:hypothetical protein